MRIKINLPEAFTFSTDIPVRITDLNYGKHVGNDTILTLIHEARVQFLAHNSFSEMDICGASLIMSDVAIEFRSELMYGDALKIELAFCDITRVGFDICYRLTSGERTIAHAKTGMVCFDYTQRKVVSIPAEAVPRLKG